MRKSMQHIVAVILSLALIVVFFQPRVFAEDTNMNDPRFDELAKKYDVEFIALDNNQVNMLKDESESGKLLSFKILTSLNYSLLI